MSTNLTKLRIQPTLTSSFLSTEGGFAQKSRVILKYEEVVSSTGVAGASNFLFNLNSLFDPNRTGTGHQPQYFDIWKQIYNRYRVIEAHIEISTYGTASQEITLVVQNHAGTYSSTSAAQEQPWSVSRTNASPTGFATIVCTAPLHVIQGSTKAQYLANEDTASLTTSSPTETIVANINLQDWSVSSSSTTSIKVAIWFHTEFYDRLTLVQS
jgi:hypothetical protein